VACQRGGSEHEHPASGRHFFQNLPENRRVRGPIKTRGKLTISMSIVNVVRAALGLFEKRFALS